MMCTMLKSNLNKQQQQKKNDDKSFFFDDDDDRDFRIFITEKILEKC